MAALAPLLIAAAIGLMPPSVGFGSVTDQTQPPLVITSMYGRDLFEFYCASCHGRDGKGHGAVAARLKHVPPDLTTLTTRYGGVFPRVRIQSTITGEDASMPPEHGTREMPVWGPIFRWLDPEHERATRIRIANLTDYIESLQRPQ